MQVQHRELLYTLVSLLIVNVLQHLLYQLPLHTHIISFMNHLRVSCRNDDSQRLRIFHFSVFLWTLPKNMDFPFKRYQMFQYCPSQENKQTKPPNPKQKNRRRGGRQRDPHQSKRSSRWPISVPGSPLSFFYCALVSFQTHRPVSEQNAPRCEFTCCHLFSTSCTHKALFTHSKPLNPSARYLFQTSPLVRDHCFPAEYSVFHSLGSKGFLKTNLLSNNLQPTNQARFSVWFNESDKHLHPITSTNNRI